MLIGQEAALVAVLPAVTAFFGAVKAAFYALGAYFTLQAVRADIRVN